MQIKPVHFYAIVFLIGSVASSCSAPRSILTSGKVLPKGQIRFGINNTVNISSASIERSIKGSVDLAESSFGKDTVIYSEHISNLNAAFMAYSLDPISYNSEIFLRYGLGHRFDIGYRNVGGANAFDVMYQFMGSNKNCNESDAGGFYGSIGAQYSWQNFDFIKFSQFEKVQQLLGFDMSRKDIIIPLVFSKSFGPEERVGCISFGMIYSHSFINYKISPENIYVKQALENVPANLLSPISGKADFSAYGTFFNLKIGKKYVFFNFSLAMYYQNYGRYSMLGGTDINLKGISIVPSYGLQFNIFHKTKKKVVNENQI
jgi:hypothetical protein